MEGLKCPHCQKVSYSASPRSFSPCPHCKFRFAIAIDDDHKYVIIDSKLAAFRDNYQRTVSEESGDEFEVIVDRRARQRPFSGIDRRRVTSPR